MRHRPLNLQAYALGIDLGTSAVRIVAVSSGAEIIEKCYAAIEATAPTGKTVTQDPSTWWLATQAALLAIGERINLKDIQGISIDATSGTILTVDELGRPLSSGSMYNAKALPGTIEALARVLPKDSAARGDTSPLARMIELQRPGVHKLLHQADWLTGQFSGRFDISDENNAMKSGFDLITRAWPTWIGDTQLNPQLLPQVVPPGTDLGPIRPEVAAHFGLSNNVRILSGTTDGCASFIATGARQFGDAVTSLGTTLTVKQLCSMPIAAAKFGVYSHRLADRWLCGGASNSGGGVLLQHFSKQEITALEARLAPEQATNLNYYPLPGVGERFPHADAFYAPRMEPRPDDDAQFLQGLLEGIASIEKAGYICLKELGAPPIQRVITVGGGARNEAWRLIRERLMGIPIISGVADAAYGTALLAMSALKQESLFASDEAEPR